MYMKDLLHKFVSTAHKVENVDASNYRAYNRPWDSQQISRFESLKKGPKIVAIFITFIV